MQPGDRFGNYVLEERLAEGGMAEVFRAQRLGAQGVECEVCVKRILAHLITDREFVDMFVDEARMGSRLRHPNVVRVEDFGETDGQYFLCMEYVRGADLATLLRKLAQRGKVMPESVAAYIANGVLQGLDHAHRRLGSDGLPLGIVHRDISPHNVLLSYAGEVKVTDFGIAKARVKLHQTVSGVVKGKIAYMPPEQLRAQTLDGRADLFALGATLFEMLTGRRPFQGATESDLVTALLAGKRPALASRRPDVSNEMITIVDRLLEPDVNKRYATARDALADLEKIPVGVGAARALASMLGYFFPGQASLANAGFSLEALPDAPGADDRNAGARDLATAPTSPATPATGRDGGALTDVDISTSPERGHVGGGDTDVDARVGDYVGSDRTEPGRPPPGAVTTGTVKARLIPRGVDLAPTTDAAPDERESSPTERTRTMVAKGNANPAPAAIGPDPAALPLRAEKRVQREGDARVVLYWALGAGAVAFTGLALLAWLLR